jgi:hypothetical protein
MALFIFCGSVRCGSPVFRQVALDLPARPGNILASLREKTHAFIIRIWVEPREIKGARPDWRGVIEHVGSGEKRSFRNLDEIARFIEPRLEQLGIRLGAIKRFKRWLTKPPRS